MRVFLSQKSVPAASALICLMVILPALAFAQDFDSGGFDFGGDAGGFDFGGGDFFGGDTGGSFGSDTGITFSDDAGSIFSGDAGVAFEESGTDTGFSPGGDTGIGAVDAGGSFGGDSGFFFEDGTNIASGVDFGGGFGFDSGGFADFGGSFGFEPGSSAAPPSTSSGQAAPAASVITETPFSEPTAPAAGESVPFFPTAGPEPFVFAGSAPLPTLSISEPLQPVTLHRSSITLAEIPYTGVGSMLAMGAFILGVFSLSGIAAFWLAARFRPRQDISPGSPRPPRWKTQAAFAGW